ncbi:MAG: helix-turn-helix domain-containing protein [Bacilli bacterium]|nr:helix-turn-helix domain-containing protein [Bacilli bacterium]
MKWHYCYLSKEIIDINELKGFFEKEVCSIDSFRLVSVKEGEIVADDSLLLSIFSFVAKEKAAGNEVTFVISHANDGWTEMMLHSIAPKYYPGQVSFMSDLILKQMSFGDFSSFAFLSALFRSLPEELLETGKAYLSAGLDAKLAADLLIVHRNTFNYRLNRFIEASGVDIRDYHNAMLLDYYLRMRVK